MSALSAANSTDATTEKALVQAVRRYCRSIELCDGYLRGYYGIRFTKTTDRLISLARESKKAASGPADANHLSPSMIHELNKKAQMKLEEIVRQYGAGINTSGGYDTSEIISTKALLDRTS